MLRLLSQNERRLRGYGIQRPGFFGSFQRDQPTSDSDVDLDVEFAPGQATFDHLMELGEFCEIMLGRRVEIVTSNSLGPHLGASILRDFEYVLR
ncbi:MAG: nucleotidyltransferase [Chromatiaceae bacterium]|nr:MAG: nucleotidyltransferase [Chromatiaceae bacterium]